MSRAHIDGLWAYVGNKGERGYGESEQEGEFWSWTVIEPDTKLRAARGLAKSERQAAQSKHFRCSKVVGIPRLLAASGLRRVGRAPGGFG